MKRTYNVAAALDHLKRQGKIYNPVTENIINNTKRNRLSIQRQIGEYQSNKLVLISCTKSKAFTGSQKSMRASDAYCSPLFQKSKTFAQDRGLDYAILSAKHGLVWPNEKISDYDLTLSELSSTERQKWSEKVAQEIHRWRDKNSARMNNGIKTSRRFNTEGTVIALAGKSYTVPLSRGLDWYYDNFNEHPIELEEPLEGLQIGERLAELNKENHKGKKWQSLKGDWWMRRRKTNEGTFTWGKRNGRW